MSEQVSAGTDPFAWPLTYVGEGPVCERHEFVGNPNYYIKAEPIESDIDYASTTSKLRIFEELSGIKVVPHYNVIGLTQPVHEGNLFGSYELDNDDNHKVIFHIAQKIEGEAIANKREEPNPAIPIDVSAYAVEGLARYHIQALKQNLSHGDLRPNNVMYGTTMTDKQLQLYMVDLDYTFFHDSGEQPYEALCRIGRCVDYITQGHQPNKAFLPAARHILAFLERQDIREKSEAIGSGGYWRLEPLMKEYVEAL